MSDWNPNIYLSFEKERTQPSIDLAMRIGMDSPKRIIDIGCGSGSSTAVLKSRWPAAEIVGLDNSKSMLERAKEKTPGIEWVCGDASGDLSHLGAFDIVFSNAAIQWMPNHPLLLKNLYSILTDGGIFAVQVPYTADRPIYKELQKLISVPKWKNRFAAVSTVSSFHAADYYYDILSGLPSNVELWVTEYFHIMPDHKSVIKWYSGTGLRPYLDCFSDGSEKEEFLNEYESNLKKSYPPQPNGKILFPFKRIFFTARK
ncbi:MAG: methyltransferase domain-containing protein [Oscillospiraceae bacterium]|nr:methyltransferase domain-containing protein [Oscillospiraceae bacterium]